MKIIAPAKLNLYLHITGRRQDGYHFLESFFVFTEFGDALTFTVSDKISLTVDGPFSNTIKQKNMADNLVVRAAITLKNNTAINKGVHIHLMKNIPVAAGLGGGSSDAAAVLIGLNQLWELKLDQKKLQKIGLILGADVPACIECKPAFVSGIGEIVKPIHTQCTSTPVLLINPNVPLSTQTVFKTFEKNKRDFCEKKPHDLFEKYNDWNNFLEKINKQHNALENDAMSLLPDIQTMLSILKNTEGCIVSRMSGSGPTCFGLFQNNVTAKRAYDQIQKHFPRYWIMLTAIRWQ